MLTNLTRGCELILFIHKTLKVGEKLIDSQNHNYKTMFFFYVFVLNYARELEKMYLFLLMLNVIINSWQKLLSLIIVSKIT